MPSWTTPFDTRRHALHAEYAPRILTGDDADLARLLAELSGLGLSYALPSWQRGEPPAYPRAIGPTQQGRPIWRDGTDKLHRKAATEIKRQAQTALAAVRKTCDAGLTELKSKYRALDDAHTAALWARVRERFDYPVFVAAPKTVGITSTGETGEGVANELPDRAQRLPHDYEAWLEARGFAKMTCQGLPRDPPLPDPLAERDSTAGMPLGFHDPPFAPASSERTAAAMCYASVENGSVAAGLAFRATRRRSPIKFSGERDPRRKIARERIQPSAVLGQGAGISFFSKIDAQERSRWRPDPGPASGTSS